MDQGRTGMPLTGGACLLFPSEQAQQLFHLVRPGPMVVPTQARVCLCVSPSCRRMRAIAWGALKGWGGDKGEVGGWVGQRDP
jgi:hypothetical protein